MSDHGPARFYSGPQGQGTVGHVGTADDTEAGSRARSGSSSWDSGAPNNATRPEPETDVTVPPRASICRDHLGQRPPNQFP